MRLAIQLLLAAATLLTSGCHAVFLRETEKYSLTVEGKADATEPVSGNFGFKQRVVLVVPGTKDGTTDETTKALRAAETSAGADRADVYGSARPAVQAMASKAAGEAVSVISYFDWRKTPTGTSIFNDPVVMRTAFVTGAAAIALNQAESTQALKAFTVTDIPTWDAAADRAIKLATGNGTLNELKNLSQVPFDRLTDQQKGRLATLTNSGAAVDYPKGLHEALAAKLK